MDEVDLEIVPTDGPMNCIWKGIYEKGWLSLPEIIVRLKGCHYSAQTLRGCMSKIPETSIQKRMMAEPKSKFGSPFEYRVVEGSTPPGDLSRAGFIYRKKPEIDPVKYKKTLDASAAALNLMQSWVTSKK